MNELHKLFAEALAQSRLDVTALDETDLSEVLQSEIIPECAASALDELKQRAPNMLREHREMEKNFQARNFERWAQGFDLLEMLIVIAEETGEAINCADRPTAVEENDAQFEADVTLHARAVLVAREILCLLKNGFADGALGRWRTLHEVAVVTQFLAKNDRNISERYLLHRAIQSHKAMLQYREYQVVANLEPFDEHDAREIAKIRDHVITKHGKEMIHDWGWAAPAVGNNKPTFFDIEKILNLDHWRPRYRWAAQDTHGGYRPPTVLLGMSEAKEPLLLVGPSNSGLTDPAHMTAISLVLATSALTNLSPTIDRLVTTQIMLILSDEIGEAFFKIDFESSQGIQCE
jgi:Family of unknown function (DUF5677)